MLVISSLALLASFSYAFHVFRRKRMNAASNYALYFLFAALYSVFPLLTIYGIEPSYWFAHFTLHESEPVVAIHVLMISVCNVVFASVYSRSYTTIPLKRQQDRSRQDALSLLLWVGYMAASAVLLYAGYKSSYTSGRGEMVHSAISNAKVLLAALYVLYLVLYGFSLRTAVMLAAFLALVLVEHSRWYSISVFIATLMYIQNTGRVSSKQMLLLASAFMILLSYVGLYRCDVEIRHLVLLANPFYIEGDYGSYCALQTHYLVLTNQIRFYTFFIDYIVDPMIYMTPRVFFAALGVDKETVGLLPLFISSHQHYLTEQYAPVGGFHYIAQASSALPFLGPLIVTLILARFTVRIENRMSKSKLQELTYYLYASGFFFVFLKTRFDLTVKYYLTLAVPAYLLYEFFRRMSASSSKPKEQDEMEGDNHSK